MKKKVEGDEGAVRTAIEKIKGDLRTVKSAGEKDRRSIEECNGERSKEQWDAREKDQWRYWSSVIQ